eukprot:SAG31_NODE_453_length_15464_cov_37.074064_4_plen_41_part_00
MIGDSCHRSGPLLARIDQRDSGYVAARQPGETVLVVWRKR